MQLILTGCTATPFGNYLKALGIFRLVAEQADHNARGHWDGDTFTLESELTADGLAAFFLECYEPTSILAPWNGGSGFYPKDNREGIDAIAASQDPRFARYGEDIRLCREFPEVQQGKSEDEDERRTAILRHCRNRLSEGAVAWLDAAVGIAADGSRAFAPVLGTGGNEGRLDYTNNFMSRIASLLISPGPKVPVRELLESAIFGHRTTALQSGAAGQYDPGRAGGANQGPGVSSESLTNPWELVLTLEGAVAWASGLYRRQGTGYRAVLCSPFTVRASAVGYGSSAGKQDARAEIWAPLWRRPAGYEELKALLREGRATVQGRPAANGLEFAEAACSLGVDRGIERFVRYSLLKRRGDSYVALPVGTFRAEYRTETDRVREIQQMLNRWYSREFPSGMDELRRGVDAAIYEVLLHGGKDRMRQLMRSVGRMIRRVVTTSEVRPPARSLAAGPWLDACDFDAPEVRIAAAVASIWSRGIGPVAGNLSRTGKQFAWVGANLPERMIAVLTRRLQLAEAEESDGNPVGGACAIHPGDVTLFLEGSVDDAAIEELLFAFLALDWEGFKLPEGKRLAEPVPVYQVLKHLFVAGDVDAGGESVRLRADARILSLLRAGKIPEAAALAIHRLRVARLRPLAVAYSGGAEASRLAAALLIPVWKGKALSSGVLHPEELSEAANV